MACLVRRLALLPNTLCPHVRHSWHATQVSAGWDKRLQDTLQRHPHAGIGEAGLHFARLPRVQCCAGAAAAGAGAGAGAPHGRPDAAVRGAQVDILRTQVCMGIRMGRTVTVHCVGKGSGEALRRLLLETGPFVPPAALLLHAYSLGAGLVTPLLKAGGNVFFSFCASVMSCRGHRRVRESVAAVPLGRLLVETDSPDQAPDARDYARVTLTPDGLCAHRRWAHRGARHSEGLVRVQTMGSNVGRGAYACDHCSATATRLARGVNEPGSAALVLASVTAMRPERCVDVARAVFANAVRAFRVVEAL